jgi:uncharacterized alkaline shock family protein YloU
MVKYTNEFGKVGFNQSVFAAIAADTMMGFSGRAIMSTPKGRPIKAGKNLNEKYSFINITENKAKNTINAEIYVILKLGTGIKWFTSEFAKRMRIETEAVTGISIDEIIINITGIKSKKIAKRELRIPC